MPTAERLMPADLDELIGESKLPPWARHIFRVYAMRCDWDTGAIPERRNLSITQLQHITGHARRTVREGLYLLQEEGWISRRPPPEDRSRREHAKTETWVHRPGSQRMQAIRESLTGPDHRARRAMHRKRYENWRDQVPHWANDNDLVELAQRTLSDAAGRPIDEETARGTVAMILGGHNRGHFKTSAERYLTHSITEDPARFLPTYTPPPVPKPAEEPPPDVAQSGAEQARQLLRDRSKPPP